MSVESLMITKKKVLDRILMNIVHFIQLDGVQCLINRTLESWKL